MYTKFHSNWSTLLGWVYKDAIIIAIVPNL